MLISYIYTYMLKTRCDFHYFFLIFFCKMLNHWVNSVVVIQLQKQKTYNKCIWLQWLMRIMKMTMIFMAIFIFSFLRCFYFLYIIILLFALLPTTQAATLGSFHSRLNFHRLHWIYTARVNSIVELDVVLVHELIDSFICKGGPFSSDVGSNFALSNLRLKENGIKMMVSTLEDGNVFQTRKKQL